MKEINLSIPNKKETITYIIGQNKLENDEIITLSNPEDVWFHISNNTPSCHVIAKVSDLNSKLSKKERNYIIKHGGLLCKQYTNNVKSSSNIEFVYTQVKNVEKTDIPGKVIISEENSKICKLK